MSTPIEHVSIVPSYARGFTFSWTIARELADPGPWAFWVQSAPTQDGPWENVSPQLVSQYMYQSEHIQAPKDPVLYFRIRMLTPAGEYYSAVRTPYVELNRRDYLQAREIMRNEVVQARLKAGILGKVWMKSVFGPTCTECVDPITGDVENPDCSACDGTGIVPGYHGPYDAWMTFTASQRNKQMQPDELGPHEDYVHMVRMVGCPIVKKDDVLVDPIADRRYYVNAVTNVMELRRVPLIQQVEAREAPTSEQIYRL